MKEAVVRKICERCDEPFEVPLIKVSRARELLLQFFPCPHCAFVKDIHHTRYNRSGRCRSCSIPFTLVDHQAKGYCNRDYMRQLRHKTEAVS